MAKNLSSRSVGQTGYDTPALRAVMGSGLCAGCGMCAGISDGSVEMELDAAGYLRPREITRLSSEKNALIEAACPGLRVERPVDGAGCHPLWGVYESADLGWSTDDALRHHGSSGGALSAIARYLIDSGRVDFVLTNKAHSTDPVSNETVPAGDAGAIFTAAGSRYAPSAPLADIGRYLAGDRRFAVIGKPCDISALRALAKHDPRIDEKIPVMLSFFCAGVPSRKGATAILEALNVSENEVEHFQYRGDGWPGKAKAVLKDGRQMTMSYAASWGGVLSKHVQFRCKICPDGTGGSADIVCADAWHSDDDGYPLFEDAEGRSLILARTKKGGGIIEAAAAAGAIERTPFDITVLASMQPGQTGRAKVLLARLAALPFKGRHLPRYDGFSMLRNAWTAGLLTNLRNFLGTLRRI